MKILAFVILPLGILAGVMAFSWMRAEGPVTTEEMPHGTQFYASPEGSPKGDGSMASPWDFNTALSQPPNLRPGDIVNVRAGTYRTPDGSHFYSKLTGAEGKYILVRPYTGEHVLIAGGIQVDGPYVIFRDLEVSNNNPDRLSEQATSFPTDTLQLVGFNVFASNVKIINNIVHDNAAGLDSWAAAPDNEFYGNLVYYNGWKSVDRGHGHGIYMQNTTGMKYIRDNIIFSQFASGMQLYGTDQADLNNFHIEGNIVFNNGVLNKEHQRNILLGGGRVAKNPVIKDNYMYFPPEGTLGGDHNIGYYPFGVGCSDVKITGNYLVADGPALNLYKCTVDRLEGNTFYGELKGFEAKDYPNNKYYDRTAPPQGTDTFVRPNRFEQGRANIVIFNWGKAETVTVNVSASGLAQGDRYQLRTAQDYFGDVQTGVLNGDSIQVSMINRSVAAPWGVEAPPSTFPQFGVFIISRAPPAAAK